MTPGRVIVAALLLCLAFCAAAILSLVGRPYAPLPPGAVPLSVNGVDITGADLIEEPDKLPDYAAQRAFFARQSVLAAELDKPGAEVGYALPGTSETASVPVRPRSFGDLPAPFWFQLGVGGLALLIGAWIFALRPRDWGARMFALTGVCVPIFAIAASVYSTRQIALPGDTFRLLSGINHFGAGTFGIGLVALFAMYPRQLFRPVWLLVPAVGYGILIAVDLAHAAPIKVLDFVVMSQTLIALGLAIVQWVLSRRQPVDRAGLRWLVLSVLIGVSAFVGLSVVPEALGLRDSPLLPQGYAFGFFLIMHVGIALGLLRYRLFDLDRYAYVVWFWVGSAALIILFDAVFLWLLSGQPWVSLSLALLLVSFIYFPARQLLLNRIMATRSVTLTDNIPEILRTALAPAQADREQAWTDLLNAIWSPLVIDRADPAPASATLREQGLALALPPSLDVGAQELRYAAAGRRLFNPQDRKLADTLCGLADIIRESRAAFEQGVTTERDRISRDVHDNIGAQILSALHTAEADRKNELLRDTLADLRSIINQGFQGTFTLPEVLADLRSESADRLLSHGITLDWDHGDPPDRKMSLAEANALRSVVREGMSNAIRHADCSHVTVVVDLDDTGLRLEISDDGRGFDPAQSWAGNGLSNMRTRLSSLGGSIQIGPAQPIEISGNGVATATQTRKRAGTRIALRMPISEGTAVAP